MRLRILWGMLLMVGGLAVYSLLVMKLATDWLPQQLLAEAIFYPLAGTIWLYPAAKLTRWMQDLPDPPSRFDP